MLNLDEYLNKSVEIKLKGKVIEILQPSARITKEIGKLEKEITEENYLDIKSKITYKLLNNNSSHKRFSMEEIDEIPYKLQDLIINEITSMIYEADNDPN